MEQNIVIAGATFNGVPSIEIPTSGGGSASFVEVSDTTATAADVAQGKYFYTANGVKTEGTGGGSAVVQPLSVTQNGTYTPPSGVDGYAPVTVNVSGGGGDEPIIPSTYKRLEYVTSSGGTSTANPKAGSYATNRGPKILNGQYIQIVASNDKTSEATVIGISAANSEAPFDCYYSSNTQYAYNSVALAIDKKQWKDATAASAYPLAALWKATADLRQDFYICAYRDISTTGSDYPYFGKIYRIIVGDTFNVKIDGTVNITGKTLDFIPCQRLADDKVGLYDWINDEFYPSEGGTEFIAGPDVN